MVLESLEFGYAVLIFCLFVGVFDSCAAGVLATQKVNQRIALAMFLLSVLCIGLAIFPFVATYSQYALPGPEPHEESLAFALWGATQAGILLALSFGFSAKWLYAKKTRT